MKEDTTITPFRHADSIDDPLTEIAREGARRMLAEALKAEADAFVASFADDVLADGRQRMSGADMAPSDPSRPGSGRSTFADRRSGTGAGTFPRQTGCGSPRTSCQNGHGTQRVSMSCCQCSTCAASRPATSGRRCQLFSVRTRRTFRRV